MVTVTGGRMLLQDDPIKAAQEIEDHILAKRKEIGFAV
jgi:hydroxylamine reductase (hybrid-cluster protein)